MNKIFKKILSIFVWVLFISAFVFCLGFSSIQRNKIICNNISVTIVDSTENMFVDPDFIKEFLNQKKYNILNNSIEKLPLNKIESDLNDIAYVKHSEVYTTIDGTLHVVIEQRNPVIRVINSNGSSYYIDNEARLFPLSDKYTARVIVASGFINEPYNLRFKNDITKLQAIDEFGKKYIDDDLYIVAKKIVTDEFFNSYFEQIYVNSNNEFELIPKVGDFTVLLGDIQNIDEKFENFKNFIKLAMPRQGWNIYKTINIKFNNQIVCTKINQNE